MTPASALALTAAAALLHPQDGPDADVRVRIEPTGVTFQVVLNLAFVDEIADVPREDEMRLDPAEHGAARELVFEYLRDHNVVEIDGVEVTAIDTGFEVLEPDLALLPHFPRFGTRAMTKLRWDLRYPAKSPPRRVAMTWGPYPPDYVLGSGVLEGPDGAPPLEVVAHLAAAGRRSRIVFSEHAPRHVWQGDAASAEELFLPVPEVPEAGGVGATVAAGALWAIGGIGVLAALLRRRRKLALLAGSVLAAAAGFAVGRAADAPLPDREQALAIFRPLHENIYRAFDYVRESDVYDALARSVHGDLLDELYDEIYRSLVLQEEGGAVSEVQAVRHMETAVEDVGPRDPDGRPGFDVVCRWQVDGAVFHWGHSHWRTNEYRARYGVRATGGGWRIVDSQVLEQLRVDAAPLPEDGARGAFPAELLGKDL